MIKIEGWWMPDGEQHFQVYAEANRNQKKINKKDPTWDGRVMYQRHKYQHVVGYVPHERRLTAVDVGSHVGWWTHHMMPNFREVVCFEPLEVNRECWAANIIPAKASTTLHHCALGAYAMEVEMTWPDGVTGQARIIDDDGGDGFKVRTLDSFNLEDVGLIKIDVEGYESEVIAGALETIEKWHPVFCIENKGHDVTHYDKPRGAALHMLYDLGYINRKNLWGDVVLTPDPDSI